MVLAKQVQEVKEVKSWEEYVSSGLEAREQGDSVSWLLGDLALGVDKDYGEDSVGKYAYAVGVRKKTLMNYRTVSARFPQETRIKYRKLSFSHFKILTSLAQPEAWLEKADDHDWNIEMLTKEINKAYENIKIPSLEDTPPKVYRCPECGLWRLKDVSMYEVCKGHYVLEGKGIKYK